MTGDTTMRALCSVLLCLYLATAVADEIYQLDIEQQPLGNALKSFAEQSGLQVVYFAAVAEGKHAPALQGEYTANDALDLLLVGSNLTYSTVDERTYTIAAAPAAVNERGDRDSGNATPAAAPLLIAQQQAPSPAAASTDEAQVEAELEAEPARPMEEILVTGTLIRGIENRTVPMVVLDKGYIDATGYSTTSSLIESIPQNFALTNQAGVQTPGVTSTRDQGVSINLRGIGEGTTLVLLNGRRMPLGFSGSAVDVSSLPLSAIERVEVLTDGASALYGSDAVGGVVNFVMRRDYEGAETRLRAGWADSVDEYRFTQVLGANWDSGGVVLSAEYYDRDLLLASDRDFVPESTQIGSLYPEDENFSVYLSAHQGITDTVEAFADVLYADRSSFNQSRVTPVFNEDSSTDNLQLSASAGLNWRLGGDWLLTVAGSYGEDHQESLVHNFVGAPPGMLDYLFDVVAFDAKADGSLFHLPAGAVRMAIGASTRKETLDIYNTIGDVPIYEFDNDQRVNSLYGELSIPLIGEDNGAGRLELSIAGRYDDYSSFGSSFDPRFGVHWRPIESLSLRASYGTSYVAPKLSDYNLGTNVAAALYWLDPGLPTGFSHQLQVLGIDVPSLTAQEAENYSFGIEFRPTDLPGLKLGANYYDIEYDGQIGTPSSTDVALANEESYVGIIIRDPTVAQVNDYIAIGGLSGQPFFAFNPDFSFNTNFDPATVDVIVDFRRRNLSVVKTRGLDFYGNYAFTAGDNDFNLALNATYLIERLLQATAASVPTETADTINNPPDWRIRGSAAWTRNEWSAYGYLNYTDGYTDNRLPDELPVDSYTTVDARLAYAFAADRGFSSGMILAVNAQNLFDEDPPATALVGPFDVGFDTTNASPMGRLISVELTKTW
jgi:outer membrane receptor protein involved in Fe transport